MFEDAIQGMQVHLCKLAHQDAGEDREHAGHQDSRQNRVAAR